MSPTKSVSEKDTCSRVRVHSGAHSQEYPDVVATGVTDQGRSGGGDQEWGCHLPLNLGYHHLGVVAWVDQLAAVVWLEPPVV